eukprot:5734258-Pleurochrysis_carterae.AAC.1
MPNLKCQVACKESQSPLAIQGPAIFALGFGDANVVNLDAIASEPDSIYSLKRDYPDQISGYFDQADLCTLASSPRSPP